MRLGILFLVVVALGTLAALLWWRFKGPGRPAAPVAVAAARNHHSLRTFHYEPAAAGQAAAASAEAGAALARLLPEEDLALSASAHSPEQEQAAPPAGRSPAAAEPPEQAAHALPADALPLPASLRPSPGARVSLLDGPEEATTVPVTPASGPAPETDEPPPEALFHNPITAPAPTPNDQANRAAEIALRQQRRARMSADAAAQRAALGGLFPGAGSPIPTATAS